MQRSGGIFYQFFSLGGDRKDKDLVTFWLPEIYLYLVDLCCIVKVQTSSPKQGGGGLKIHFSFQYVTSSFFFCLASQNIASKGIIYVLQLA